LELQVMNGILNFNKHLYKNTGKRPGTFKLSLIGRSLFLALVLVLSMDGAGYTLPALAAPARATKFQFFMSARKDKGNATVCVGDIVPIHVKVMRAEVVGDPANLGYAQPMPGVRIQALISNKSIGTLTWTTIDTGWNFNDPGGADFKFHADKAGSTMVEFNGTIRHVWWGSRYLPGLPPLTDRKDHVTSNVEIIVEECQYKVTAVSTFIAPGVKLVAEISDAGLTLAADGRFTGTGSVTWVGGPVSLYGCSGTMEVDPSQAEIVAVKGPDQLVLQVTYRETTLSHIYDCKPGSVEIHPPVLPDPIILSVPVSGGSTLLDDQTLTATCTLCEAYTFPGFVSVIVTRVAQH
jgi:hypothetical protein